MTCVDCKFRICTFHDLPFHDGETCAQYDTRRREEEQASIALVKSIS
jgi:hypothetical protein